MKRARHALISIFMLVFAFAAAQDGDVPSMVPSEIPPDLPEVGTDSNPYRIEDAIFSIQLGANVPLFIQSMSDGSIGDSHLYMGGSISLRYMVFVSKVLALGGEGGASFNLDIAKRRTLYMVPLTFEALWFPVKMPFEFPIGIGVGAALLNLGAYYHVDPILKPEAGLFYRLNPTWSFGGTISYHWLLDIYGDGVNDQFGNFLDIKLSALYRL